MWPIQIFFEKDLLTVDFIRNFYKKFFCIFLEAFLFLRSTVCMGMVSFFFVLTYLEGCVVDIKMPGNLSRKFFFM